MSADWTLLALAALAPLIWSAILLHPARPAACRPIAADGPDPPAPRRWPSVAVLVPARNEAESLPRTLPSLLGQDYPGPWRVVVVDDRSSDGTAETARRLAAASPHPERLQVLAAPELPESWLGKPWALEQGRLGLRTDPPDWILQTDADIEHAPDSLRRLVAEALADGLALNSRMARLHCAGAWEKLLVPAFVWFFNLLYPMSRVNDPGSPVAAAAGGCVLVNRRALEALGGYGFMKSAVIDDCTLARAVKGAGARLRLAWSRDRVISTRPYRRLHDLRRMIRRTAFTELRHSGWRLAACLVGLAATFALPPFALTVGALSGRPLVAALGLLAWTLMAWAYSPAPRFYDLRSGWCWTLPLAAILYGAFTFESAWLHWRGRREAWRAIGARDSERA